MGREKLAGVITVIWGVATVASLVSGETTALAIVTPVMLIVAGFFFSRPGNGKGNAR